MPVKSLRLLLLLTLAALPAWSAPVAAPSSAPQVTLADILAPAPAQPAAPLDLGLFSSPRPQQKISCYPTCSTIAECRTYCGCDAANCNIPFGCSTRSCDCSNCP